MTESKIEQHDVVEIVEVKPKEKTYDRFGRPRLDTEEMMQAAVAYIKEFDYFATEVIKTTVDGKITEKENKVVQGIPSIAGLSRRLGVDRKTLYNWEGDENNDFFHILNELRAKQEEFLLFHGLTKGYDSGFAKFVTTNLTKFKEKVETVSEVNTTVKLAYKDD